MIATTDVAHAVKGIAQLTTIEGSHERVEMRKQKDCIRRRDSGLP